MRVGFLLVCCALFRLGSSARPFDDESLFDVGRRLQANAEYFQAETAYRAFLKQQPQSVPALTNLGIVLAHEGRFEEAVSQYRRALALDPVAAPAKVNLALAYYRMSEWEKSAQAFEDVLHENPSDHRALQLLAICDTQTHQYSKAVLAYKKLLPTQDPSILIGLASALREAGERGESEKVLASVLEQYSNSPEVQYLLGLAQFTRQDYEAAAISFGKMIELAPARVDGYFYLGATYLKQRKLDAAVQAWRQAVHVDRQYFAATFALGALLAEMNRYDEAKPFLQNALTQRPKDAATQLEIGRFYLHQEELEQALKYLKGAAEQDRSSKQASFLLATTYRRLGKQREAAAEFQRSRQLFSKDTTEVMLTEANKVNQEAVP